MFRYHLIMHRELPIFVVLGCLLPTGSLHAQSIFGRNLIVNAGAESGPSDSTGDTPVTTIPGWTKTGAPDVVQYAAEWDLSLTDVLPMEIGASYFYGGLPKTNSALSQTIDLSQGAAAIDGGAATFVVSGYFGGYHTESENVQMTVKFLGSNGAQISTITIGPVLHSDRADTSGLWYRRAIGPVPVGARTASVTVQFNYVDSSHNDGAADNLSLVLNAPTAPQSLLGINLITNGNAEMPVTSDPTEIDLRPFDVPGWCKIGMFTVDAYADGYGNLYEITAIPPDAGKQYFYGGGDNSLSSGSQDIDVSSAASLIDARVVNYALSGWLGGYYSQNDNATLLVEFRNWIGTALGSATLGPVMATDRNDQSCLLQRSQNGIVPAGTRYIHLVLTFTRTDGADNDGMADSLSLVLSSPGVTSVTPYISGVVNDASFTPGGALTPGSWVAIFGSNLAPVGDVRKWVEGTEIVNGTLPLSLDGTSATVNGQPAVIEFISPNQVNIQPPDDTTIGPVQVVIKSAIGTTFPFTVQLAQFAPGLFPSTAPYLVAQHSDNSYVTPLSPAKPGEVIILWGTGFGPASPPVSAGKVFSGSNQLANPVTITIGGQSALVDFAGIVGAGLVQINVHVPSGLANGDAPVVATAGGIPTQTTANMIPIHQ